jgi:hypothetical protein
MNLEEVLFLSEVTLSALILLQGDKKVTLQQKETFIFIS